MTAGGICDEEGRDRPLPTWLTPLVAVAAEITAPQLTRMVPPEQVVSRPASVLILFGDGAEGPDVLLLERSHDMRSHAGQVAFPGGAQDTDDADEVDAAIREAVEETGLDPVGVQILGTLPRLWLPPSNFSVTPVLAWWRIPSHVWAVDPAETASVHTVPLAQLLAPANRVTLRHPSGFLGPAFLVQGLVVWGFTAGILSRLFEIVGWEQPWDASRVVELPADLLASSLRDVSR